MKTLKLVLISILALLTFAACETEPIEADLMNYDSSTKKSKEVKMVPFKGNFSSFPIDMTPIDCLDPATGVIISALKNNAVSGNATHLGILDSNQSPLFVVDCALDGVNQTITTTLDMTLKNKKGDGIRIFGESILSVAGPSTGNFEIIEGYGKFEGATGSLETTGFFNFDEGTTVFRAEGFVSQPNQ